jgi:Cu-processing system ATP-binding protein
MEKSPPDPVVDIDDVSKRYGDVVALQNVSLAVDPGRTVGIVGTNGAGKTTLFRLIAGQETPDSGRVRAAGLDPTAGPAVRRHVGFLPEDARFQPSLTGREVLTFHARVRRVPAGRRNHRIERILKTVGLRDVADRRVGTYSNGMQRRLGLATMLLLQPRVLLLDEPTAGLDPVGVEEFHALVDRIQAQTEVTICFSTHALGDVERLCDRVVVLDDGEVRDRGSLEEISRLDHTEVVVWTSSPPSDPTPEGLELETASRVHLDDATGRLIVECPTGEALEVLDDLRAMLPIERFTVQSGGLEEAFLDAVDPENDRVRPNNETSEHHKR